MDVDNVRAIQKDAIRKMELLLAELKKVETDRVLEQKRQRPSYIDTEYKYILRLCMAAAEKMDSQYNYFGMDDKGVAYLEVIERLKGNGFHVTVYKEPERTTLTISWGVI